VKQANGERNGMAQERTTEGSVYEGNFLSDRRHAGGSWVHSLSSITHIGQWLRGQPAIDPAVFRMRMIKPPPVPIEEPKEEKKRRAPAKGAKTTSAADGATTPSAPSTSATAAKKSGRKRDPPPEVRITSILLLSYDVDFGVEWHCIATTSPC
jgi:hypothetical protein